jgi:hypothetical protein
MEAEEAAAAAAAKAAEAAASAARQVEEEFREDERVKTERKRNTEIAINLIRMNFPDEQIALATGLAPEEVRKLREEAGNG